ncbi:MAG: cobalamin-binding protein [Balneolaceae bacterium]|nr:cobalamin-binding protein [Balneolaceae bacterium]
MNHSPRIVSLLPSTTEIVCRLGMQQYLVGRSHECDFPPAVKKLPYCTEPKFEPDGTSYEIDQRVKALLQEGLSVYRVNSNVLTELQPDLIITQDHCKVCAASLSEVKQAVKKTLDNKVEIISVSPTNLDEVFESIRTIASTLKIAEKGITLIENLKKEFAYIKSETHNLPSKSICCIEWLDPIMTAGNWVPELIQIAGGKSVGAKAGSHSPFINWDKLQKYNPKIMAIMPCGYNINQTLKEIDTLTSRPEWETLNAVQNDQVYILEGNQYFNRPGPRLVESAQILAEIFHPDHFEPKLNQHGWIHLTKAKT